MLDRTNTIEIRSPQRNGGERCVGIAAFKVKSGKNRVKIMYTRKDGERSYPLPFEVDGNKILSYPTMKLAGGTVLHMVPVADMKTVGKPVVPPDLSPTIENHLYCNICGDMITHGTISEHVRIRHAQLELI